MTNPKTAQITTDRYRYDPTKSICLVCATPRKQCVDCARKDLLETGSLNPVFRAPMVVYTPAEIRRIRQTLGETVEKFAERFKLSATAVKAWETPEGQAKHRECEGPAAVLMWWAAQEANARGCKTGNLIRLASRYGVE